MVTVRAIKPAFYDGSRVRVGAVLEVTEKTVKLVAEKVAASKDYKPWFVVVPATTPITVKPEPVHAGQAPVALSQLGKTQPVTSQVAALKAKPDALA